MSDMSVPPLTLVPPDLGGPGAGATAARSGVFTWPVPPEGSHGQAEPLGGPEPAEIEGPNGTVTLCRLISVDVDTGKVQIQTGTSRGPLSLKLGQFRRLTLLRPLKPLADQPVRPSRAGLLLVRLAYRDGHVSEVKSLGSAELPIGHFTFSPLNAQGHLLRSFYPRPMVAEISRTALGRTSVDKVLAAAAAAAGQRAPETARSPVLPPDQMAAATIRAAAQGTQSTQGTAPARPPAAELPARPPAHDLPRLADPLPPLDFSLEDPRTPASAPGAATWPSTPTANPTGGPASARPPQPTPTAAGRSTARPPAGLSLADAPLPNLSLTPLATTATTAGTAPGTPATPATAARGPGAAAARPAAPAASTPTPTGAAQRPGSAPPLRPSAAQAPAKTALGGAAGAGPAARTRSSAPPVSLAQLPELTEVLSLADAPAAGLSSAPGLDHQATPARSISDILQMQQISTPPQLLEAIEQQARMPMVRIGEALMALGFITEQKLGDALQAQSRDRSLPLGELLVRRGDVSRTNLQTALARKMGYPVVNATMFPTEQEAVRRLQLAIARRLPALPLMVHQGRLIVALEDPSARNVIDEIEFTAQCKVVPVLARAGTLLGAIEQAYLQSGNETIDAGGELSFNFGSGDRELSTDKLLADLEQEDQDTDTGPIIEQSDNSLVRLINTMIVEARQQGVSDIHIECPPPPQKVKVRFRRDGVLRPYLELPPGYRQAIVARIKIMCDLDISERRKPQDGKITFSRFMAGHKLELRVATIPTANGLEDVVMRLLSSSKALPLDAMMLAPDILAKLRATMERPYGLVLCVGPTGSGKTTTLHAALAHINTPERKIWTAEDPVEITQPGLRQVQVNSKIDWTFAKALRAFLRADPDVVMVGEVRDEETASMAIEASLTGHLVLSTLHTNSAPETVTRLLDMGMDPFSFSDSLLSILAQRLVRRWCRDCVTSQPMDEDLQQSLLSEYLLSYPDESVRPARDAVLARWTKDFGREGRLMHHHAPGCAKCGGSGFDGRLGLHELLVVSRDLRLKIQQKAPAIDLQRQAMADGMRTLRQDGILKVLAGLTSVEEVRAISNQ